MKNIKQLVLYGGMLAGLGQAIIGYESAATAESARQPKKLVAPVKASVAAQKEKVGAPAAKLAAPRKDVVIKPVEKKQPESDANSARANQLIHDFIESVDQIRGTCRSKIGQQSDDSQVEKHREQVEISYKKYKAMYDFFKQHQHKISKKENDKINPAVNKLFECKNIKNMVWGGHVDEQKNKVSDSSASSDSKK